MVQSSNQKYTFMFWEHWDDHERSGGFSKSYLQPSALGHFRASPQFISNLKACFDKCLLFSLSSCGGVVWFYRSTSLANRENTMATASIHKSENKPNGDIGGLNTRDWVLLLLTSGE